jgi:hypothetical protein
VAGEVVLGVTVTVPDGVPVWQPEALQAPEKLGRLCAGLAVTAA